MKYKNILKILKIGNKKNYEKVSYQMRTACLIDDAMKFANISKSELANLMGKDISEVELWLSGTYDMDNITLFNILYTISRYEFYKRIKNED